MARRSGVTLLEVLVAIFVMGIGLLALLTLFPLGALRMAKAIQDDRTAAMASNARAIAIMQGLPWDPLVQARYATVPGVGGTAVVGAPSFPVLIDPIGFQASSQPNVAGSFLSRLQPSSVASPPPGLTAQQAAVLWFTLQDDIVFENAQPGSTVTMPGTPQAILPLGTPQFTRDTRYSYALMCQLGNYGDLNSATTSVVVYSKRSVTPTPSTPLAEYLYAAAYNPAVNTIMLDYTNNVPPPLRVGDWVLDNTAVPSPANAISAHADWYRIVGITDSGTALELDVEQPLRYGGNGTAIVLDGVANVYNLGALPRRQ